MLSYMVDASIVTGPSPCQIRSRLCRCTTSTRFITVTEGITKYLDATRVTIGILHTMATLADLSKNHLSTATITKLKARDGLRPGHAAKKQKSQAENSCCKSHRVLH